MRSAWRAAAARLASRLNRDQTGQMTIEWALVLAAIAIPMLYVFAICLNILVEQYRMMTFWNSLPFP